MGSLIGAGGGKTDKPQTNIDNKKKEDNKKGKGKGKGKKKVIKAEKPGSGEQRVQGSGKGEGKGKNKKKFINPEVIHYNKRVAFPGVPKKRVPAIVVMEHRIYSDMAKKAWRMIPPGQKSDKMYKFDLGKGAWDSMMRFIFG